MGENHEKACRLGPHQLRNRTAAILLFLLTLGYTMSAAAQDGKQQRIAELAYQAEMAHEGGACPDALTVADRNVCLNDARVETYKNYSTVFQRPAGGPDPKLAQ